MRINKGILLSYLVIIFIFAGDLFDSRSVIKAGVVSVICFSMLQIAFIVCKGNFKHTLFYLLAFNIPLQLYIWIPQTSLYSVETADSFSLTFLDIVILMIVVYSIFTKKTIKVPRYFSLISFFILLVYVCATLVSINKGASIYAVIRLFKAILLSFSLINTYEDEAFDFFIKGLKATVLFQMLIGTLQIIKGDVLGLSFLGEGVLRSANGYEKGMSGTVGHPGDFSLFLLFCLVMFLFNSQKNSLYIILCILGLVLGQSRTALVIMLVVFILYWFSSKGKRISYKSMGVLFLMILSTPFIVNLFGMIMSRFFNSDLSTQEENRRIHYELALKLFSLKEHFALGPNASLTATSIYFPYEFQRGVFYYVHPIHNAFLVYFIETGILGGGLYILLNCVCLWNAALVFREKPSIKRSRIISFGIWILVISAYSMTGWAGIKINFSIFYGCL